MTQEHWLWRGRQPVPQTSCGCWSSLLESHVSLCVLLTTRTMPWRSSRLWKAKQALHQCHRLLIWLPAEYQDQITPPKGWDHNLPVNNQILPLVKTFRKSSGWYEHMKRNWAVDSGHRSPVSLFICCAAGGDQPYSQNCKLSGGEWSPLDSPGDHLQTVDRPWPDLYPSLPCHLLWSADRFPGRIIALASTLRSACLSSARLWPMVRATRVICLVNTMSSSRSTPWRPSLLLVRCTAQTTSRPRFVQDLSSYWGLLKVNAEHTDNGRQLLRFSAMDANLCATRGRITNDSNGTLIPDPSMSNVFTTATYRFAHLMVQPTIFRLDENYREHHE